MARRSGMMQAWRDLAGATLPLSVRALQRQLEERLEKIPRLYETEHVPLKDKLIYLHFFIGACDWFIAEFDGEWIEGYRRHMGGK